MVDLKLITILSICYLAYVAQAELAESRASNLETDPNSSDELVTRGELNQILERFKVESLYREERILRLLPKMIRVSSNQAAAASAASDNNYNKRGHIWK